MRDTEWSSELLATKWHEVKNVFISASNRHAPFHCRRLSSRANPWFDSGILRMIYQRYYFKRQAASLNEFVFISRPSNVEHPA